MSIRNLVTGTLVLLLTACGGASGEGSSSGSSSGGGVDWRTDTVTLTASGPTAPIPAERSGDFKFTLTNLGANAAHDVNLVVTLGPGFHSFFSVDCEASGNAGCPTGINSTRVPELQPGARLTFTVHATPEYPASGTRTVTGTVTAADDANSANNTATLSATVFSADVTVAIATESSNLVPGDGTSFSMTVANLAPDAATDVSIDAMVSGHQSLVNITCTPQGGAVCPSSPALHMVVPSLAGGGSLVFQLNTVLDPDAYASVSASATVYSPVEASTINNAALGTAYLALPVVTSSPNFAIFRADSELGFDDEDYSYGASDALYHIRDDGSELSLSVIPPDSTGWFVLLSKPAGLDRWQPGLHVIDRDPGALRSRPGSADIWVSQYGAGCLNYGWFRILDVQYDVDQVVSMDVIFGANCDGRAPAVRGRVHAAR